MQNLNVELDPFCDDQAELKYLKSKPTCFIVLGKPGCGKSTLAQEFIKVWRCLLITVPDAIAHAIKNQTESGKKAQQILVSGEAVPEHLSLKILSERLSLPDVFHYGYMLEGFPCYCQTFTADEQINFLKSLTLTPDYIINLKISDIELLKRCSKLKVDPLTNYSYPVEFYSDENKFASMTNVTYPTNLEENKEENDEIEDDETEADENKDNENSFSNLTLKASIVGRLVFRYEELTGSFTDYLKRYKENVLESLENFMGEYGRQKIIELDASLSSKLVYTNLLQRTDFEPISQVFVPEKLIGPENQIDFPQDEESDEILRSLSSVRWVSPGYRWKRSKWGVLCPVAFQNGQMINGHPEYAVSFLDKMYLLSSNEAVDKFITSPRQFIIPLQHTSTPYKIAILGPHLSGTTTLSKKLAFQYKIQVIKLEEVVEEHLKKLQNERLPKLVEAAVIKVKGSDELAKRDASLETENSSKEDKSLLNEIDINENHPQVIEEVTARMRELELTAEEYVDCIEEALAAAFKDTSNDYKHSGWILDKFPQTRDQFNIMVERGIFLDNIFVFYEDNNNPVLIERWNNLHHQGMNMVSLSEKEEINLKHFKDSLIEFNQNWPSMQSIISAHKSIKIMTIPTNITEQEAVIKSTKMIEAVFQYHAWKYNDMDEDEEEEDYAAANEGEEGNEDSDNTNRKKPFGETLRFCPVKLKESNVLWPGSPDFAVKYREKVYFLSSSNAQDQFIQDPEMFLPQDLQFKIPVIRFLLLGPTGSGKSLHGRLLASKYGLLHISFKDRLQELIIHKTLKKVGPDFQPLNETEETKAEEKNTEELKFEFNLFEKNIYNNILEGEALTKETMNAILIPWWNEEPFKSKGFILEGFPRTPEEVNYLAESGLYPDGVIILTVKDEDIYNRLSPSIISQWKKQNDMKNAKKQLKKIERNKLIEEKRARRKIEILAERERLQSEKLNAILSGEDDEVDETDEEGVQSNIDDIIEIEIIEEFGDDDEEEDGEDNETEEDAIIRIKSEIIDKYNDEISVIAGLQEAFDEESIFKLEVDSSRKPQITQYLLTKHLKRQLLCRMCFFDKCQILKPNIAKCLLKQGYKKLSRFAKWCPVKLHDKEVLMPVQKNDQENFPVAYRHYIYFLSSKEACDRFVENPKEFIFTESPKQFVPVNVAVVGPPKSGKTTLAKRFVQELGLVRLSIGEVMRQVLVSHSKTELVQEMKNYLFKGYVVPDELATQALELCLLNTQCSTNGYVLDGYPCTMYQFNLLKDRNIIPYKVIELKTSDQEILQRGAKDRTSVHRMWPLHDSHAIIAIRIACYRKESVPILEFCSDQFKNLFSINAENSKWLVYNESIKEISKTIEHIHGYIECLQRGRPAPIKCMCITPNDIQSRLGEFLDYCPVSLGLKMELVNCADDKSSDLVAEYRGKFYRFSDETNMTYFINAPTKFVMPLAPWSLPKNLPKKISADLLKNDSFQKIVFQGYCPVTYVDGDKKYEHLMLGSNEFVAEYKNNLYWFASAQCLDKFMRSPEKYASVNLPKKLPPKKEFIDVSTLPRLGYMEQTSALSITKALTAVGILKPIFPFLSAKSSALIYVAYYLKAFNPKSNEVVKAKYKKKLKAFEEQCQLVSYLSRVMKRKYLEPVDRPLDLDHKLKAFFSFHAS